MADGHAATVDEVVGVAGGILPLAAALGVARSAVSNWKRSGIPLKRVPPISRLTGIPMWRLRPDIFPRPENARDTHTAQGSEAKQDADLAAISPGGEVAA